MPEIGQIVGEKYRLEHLLGEGGMGAVFEAVHIHIGSKVAIKFLHPGFSEDEQAVKRFKNEARAAGAIGHDAIVHVQDLGVTGDGSLYLVMESLRGASLAERLEEGPLSLSMAAYVNCQVLSGLHAAHEVGIIHRDMKPDNIFLVHTGAMLPGVKILDFGISRMTGFGCNSEAEARLTRTGIVMGTPAYMSPEHARGRSDIDERSDIFSVGIILYECLTGELPFNGDNYNAILAEIIIEDPAPPTVLNPDIPPNVERIILKALEKDRESRYQTAWEFFDELLPLVEETAVGRISIPSGLESVPTRRHEGHPTTISQPMALAMTEPGRADMPTTISQSVFAESLVSQSEIVGERDTDQYLGEKRFGLNRRLIPLLLVVGAVIILITAAAVGWAMLNSGQDAGSTMSNALVSSSTSKTPGKTLPEAVRTEGAQESTDEPIAKASRIELVGVPRDASIMLDGTKIPHDDLPLLLSKGGPHHRLSVVRDGYVPFQRWINPGRDQKILVTFSPTPSEDAGQESATDGHDQTGPTEPTGTRPTGTRPTGTRPTGTRPTGTRPTGTRPTGTRPSGSGQTGPQKVYTPRFID